ncbi:MAG: hypothetical protein AAGG38_14220 [Planctomycetota bacterium]
MALRTDTGVSGWGGLGERRGRWRRRAAGVCGALLLIGVGSAGALTPAELVTPELERQAVNLAGLSGGVIRFFDAERRLVRAGDEGFVRVDLGHAAAGEASGGGEPAVVRLTDGQRIAGRWVGAARGGEAVVWEHAALGRFTLRLDDITAIRWPQAPDAGSADRRGEGPGEPAAGDVVRLINGDRLVGFLVSVEEQGLRFQVDGTNPVGVRTRGQRARLPRATPPGAGGGTPGDLVVLTDGTRVRVSERTIGGETLTLVPALADTAEPVELALDRVRYVDLTSGGWRLRSLAERTMRVVSGGEAFGLRLEPTSAAGVLRLHAPVTVEFDLPEGARRLSALAELDLPADLSAEVSGLAELDVWVHGRAGAAGGGGGGGEPWRLDRDRPSARLNVELNAGHRVLRLRVGSGELGPVLDRLRLRDALLLLETPVGLPSDGEPLR